MQSPLSKPIAAVLVLKSDRLYAEVVRQFTLRVFPGARVRLAASVDAAAEALAREPVDLLITGVGPNLEGDALELLAPDSVHRTRFSRVLVVTGHRDYRLLIALRELDVDGGFDAAGEEPENLLVALRALASGQRYWSPAIVEQVRQNLAGDRGLFRFLTVLEQIVFVVIGDGSDDTSAARELGLSQATVSTVRRELHRKLGVQHRGELVRIAAQSGFVRFTPSGVIRPGFAQLSAAYRARKQKRFTSVNGHGADDEGNIALAAARSHLAAAPI